MFVFWEAEDIFPEGIESIAMAEITVEIGLGFRRTGGRYMVDLMRSNPLRCATASASAHLEGLFSQEWIYSRNLTRCQIHHQAQGIATNKHHRTVSR